MMLDAKKIDAAVSAVEAFKSRVDRYADANWDESKHKRGQPENKGQFGSGGGGKAPTKETTHNKETKQGSDGSKHVTETKQTSEPQKEEKGDPAAEGEAKAASGEAKAAVNALKARQNKELSDKWEKGKTEASSKAQKAGDKKYEGQEVDVNNIIPTPDEDDPDLQELGQILEDELDADEEDIEDKKVDLSKVFSEQDTLNSDIVEAYQSGEKKSDDRPHAYEYKGKFYLTNGNHRVAAAMLNGEKSINLSVTKYSKAKPPSKSKPRRRNDAQQHYDDFLLRKRPRMKPDPNMSDEKMDRMVSTTEKLMGRMDAYMDRAKADGYGHPVAAGFRTQEQEPRSDDTTTKEEIHHTIDKREKDDEPDESDAKGGDQPRKDKGKK
jgi:hypothetical protein